MIPILVIINIVLVLLVAYLGLLLWVKNATIREWRAIAHKWFSLFVESRQEEDFAMWREEFDDLGR